MLRHFEGRSIDEISQALGLKTNATKHSIFRAVRKMRTALEPFVAGPADDERRYSTAE
jgi:RNA polymerase sigma-70 factor (ECF subfamily)